MTSQREGQLRRLAESYTAAWCSQDAARVAGFYALDGSLRVNADPTTVDRDAIAGVAQGFIAAFPDLKVIMDDIVLMVIRRFTAGGSWVRTPVQAGPGNAFTSADVEELFSGCFDERSSLDKLLNVRRCGP